MMFSMEGFRDPSGVVLTEGDTPRSTADLSATTSCFADWFIFLRTWTHWLCGIGCRR